MSRKKRSKNVTVLAIGDWKDFDSFRKIEFGKKEFIRRGFQYYSTNYAKLLKGKLPRIREEKVVILLFFPFNYWNKHIEHKTYRGIYGNQTFYNKFVRFWERAERIIRKYYSNKEIYFINEPRLCGAYRDKMTVVKELQQCKVTQPSICRGSDILKTLANDQKFYLKPRYGSMGKGITFVSRSNWQTNFIVRGNKIISQKSDYGWHFTDITGNRSFLKQLLAKDIIAEKGLDHYIKNGDIVDLRVYVFFNEVVYIYPRRNKAHQITTNISQGGSGVPGLIRVLPRDLIEKAKKEAVKVTKSLNLDFVGIDIIPQKKDKKAYVIDVNLFSGFPRQKTFNMARCLADRLEKSVDSGSIFGNRKK